MIAIVLLVSSWLVSETFAAVQLFSWFDRTVSHRNRCTLRILASLTLLFHSPQPEGFSDVCLFQLVIIGWLFCGHARYCTQDLNLVWFCRLHIGGDFCLTSTFSSSRIESILGFDY
jgi:hypothetical protein